MLRSAARRRPTPLAHALLLLGTLAFPAGARAQLPAPPASARGPLRLGGYGSLVLGLDEPRPGASGGASAGRSDGVTGSAVALNCAP